MDAKRLEELAEWATTEANALDYEGSERASGRLRDLARCATAWAKLERECCSLGPLIIKSAWQYVDRTGRVRYGTTAISAVEAAPEVLDANKG